MKCEFKKTKKDEKMGNINHIIIAVRTINWGIVLVDNFAFFYLNVYASYSLHVWFQRESRKR